jgi:CRP-like cAMP-binding protein
MEAGSLARLAWSDQRSPQLPTRQTVTAVERELAKQAPTLVPANRVLFWQGDHQEQDIRIIKGVVRAVRLIEDGSRQILTFYWPGDTIAGASADAQLYTAEAVTPCRLCWSKPRPGMNVTTGHKQVLQAMLPLIVALSKKTTASRIAWFLLRIRKNLPIDSRRVEAQQLLLSRADIADHLGMSIETVCRTLHDFQSKRLIDLPTRRTIRFRDLAGLTCLSGDAR